MIITQSHGFLYGNNDTTGINCTQIDVTYTYWWSNHDRGVERYEVDENEFAHIGTQWKLNTWYWSSLE